MKSEQRCSAPPSQTNPPRLPGTVAPGDARSHEAEVRPDVAGQPAVVPGGLPVAGAPAVVAQPVAVQHPALHAHLHRADRRDQLLVVAAGELLARALHGLVGLAPEHGRAAPEDEVHRAGGVGVLREGPARVGHLERVGEQDHRAHVADLQLDEGGHHLEAHPRRVEGVVRRDAGSGEHEGHATVGEVEADRHLARTLVGPVPQPEERAEVRRRVEGVEVHRLVEVGLGSQLVHVLVFWVESKGHDRA